MVVVSPAAANGKGDSGGVSAGNNLNTIIFTSTHTPAVSALPNYHKMLCEFLLFCYICLSGVMSGEGKLKMT